MKHWLSTSELEEMLQVLSPEEIRHNYEARLDEQGLAFLKEREAQPDIVDLLRDSAHYTRMRLEHAGKDDLAALVSPPRSKRSFFQWLSSATMVPNPALLSLALLFLASSSYLMWRGDRIKIRSSGDLERIIDERGAELVDQALFDALKQRGLYFFNEARESEIATEKKRYYQEAYNELSQAFALNGTDLEVRTHLRKVLQELERLDTEQ